MSEERTHDRMVNLARCWLASRHPVVTTELSSGSQESPDAIGWRGGVSTLVECKASRSDYYADKHKSFRRNPTYGIGNYRYFLATGNLINPERLPANWGLLTPNGRGLRVVKKAAYVEANYTAERIILMSIIRRIGQQQPPGVSIKAYYQITAEKRPTVTVELGNENDISSATTEVKD